MAPGGRWRVQIWAAAHDRQAAACSTGLCWPPWAFAVLVRCFRRSGEPAGFTVADPL